MGLDDFLNKAEQFHQTKTQLFEKYISHILLFIFRILVSLTFFQIGVESLDDIDSSIFLFRSNYYIATINPALAVYGAVFFEILCSIMLIIGAFARIASFGLVIITLAIQYLIITDGYYLHWLVMLLTILTFGPGKITLSNLLKKVATLFKTKRMFGRNSINRL